MRLEMKTTERQPPDGAQMARESSDALLDEARSLVAQAGELEVSQRPPLLDRAADLYMRAEDQARAIRVLGDSVDALLECGRSDAAIGHCRRLLRLFPDVVRARCTLTFLLAERGDVAEAMTQLEGYVQAARARRVTEVAARRLWLLSSHPSAVPLRHAIQQALTVLVGTERAALPPASPAHSLRYLLTAGEEDLERLANDSSPPREEVAPPDLPWLDTSLP